MMIIIIIIIIFVRNIEKIIIIKNQDNQTIKKKIKLQIEEEDVFLLHNRAWKLTGKIVSKYQNQNQNKNIEIWPQIHL